MMHYGWPNGNASEMRLGKIMGSVPNYHSGKTLVKSKETSVNGKNKGIHLKTLIVEK